MLTSQALHGSHWVAAFDILQVPEVWTPRTITLEAALENTDNPRRIAEPAPMTIKAQPGLEAAVPRLRQLVASAEGDEAWTARLEELQTRLDGLRLEVRAAREKIV
jgi:hypothetical protein